MSAQVRAALQKARPLGAILFLLLTNALTYVLWPGMIGAMILTMFAGFAAKLG